MTARRIRSELGRVRRRRAFAADVIASVCEVFDVSPADLRGKRRMTTVVRPRQAACLLCYELTTLSFPSVGLQIGGREHSTVIHAADRCIETMRREPDYRRQVARAARLAIRANPLALADAVRVAEPAPVPVPKAAPVEASPDWWEHSDDELIEAAIAAHRARGGDFVEVFT
jgi:hypothetical protein